jgi:hypothetical protein
MRLRYIYRGDFRKSEVTLYDEAMKEAKDLNLGSEDCILLLSGNGKQMKFVYGFDDVSVIGGRTGAATGRQTKVYASEVVRIHGPGGWSPKMLVNYAEQAGLELSGLKRFETYYKHLIEEEDKAKKKVTKKG